MDQAAAFQRLEQVFLLLRSHEREFPAQLLQVFFYICTHEGQSQIEIGKAIGMTSSSVSRNVSWLSHHHRLGKPGLKMVYRKLGETSNKGHKYQHVFLTPKGKETARLIRKIMYPHT